ncbi:MAG TPA: hypothetical protein VK178_13610 [Opitutaceae bacterium]|nr:hypothetical protein [Opitutaceae bacterium]
MIILSVFLTAWVLRVTAELPPATNPASPADEERISVDFPNEEIVTVLRNVADMYELNLVVPQDLKGKRTSLKLRNVTWRQIFREALAPAGYMFIEDGNIVRVASIDSLKQLQVARNESQQNRTASPARAGLSRLWWFGAPVGLIHLVFALGVSRDHLPCPARFAPKFVWAFAVLLGGLAPLSIYWLIHHSSLAKTDSGGVPPKLQ